MAVVVVMKNEGVVNGDDGEGKVEVRVGKRVQVINLIERKGVVVVLRERDSDSVLLFTVLTCEKDINGLGLSWQERERERAL